MLEQWNEALDKDMSVGAIFIDLSKAFDTLNHENSLNYIQSYLHTHLQKTNANNNFSLWKDILLVFHKDLY